MSAVARGWLAGVLALSVSATVLAQESKSAALQLFSTADDRYSQMLAALLAPLKETS